MSFWDFWWKWTVFKWLFGSSNHRSDDSTSFPRQSDGDLPPYCGGGDHYCDCDCDYDGINSYYDHLDYDSFDDGFDDFNYTCDFDEW